MLLDIHVNHYALPPLPILYGFSIISFVSNYMLTHVFSPLEIIKKTTMQYHLMCFLLLYSFPLISYLSLRVRPTLTITYTHILCNITLPFHGLFCPVFPGGGTWVFRGAHTFVIKIKKYPISTDFWPKKHPYFNKTLIFSTK